MIIYNDSLHADDFVLVYLLQILKAKEETYHDTRGIMKFNYEDINNALQDLLDYYIAKEKMIIPRGLIYTVFHEEKFIF